MATAALGGVVVIGAGWQPGGIPDTEAYWLAAMRLRDGDPLYATQYASFVHIYRYAPWFAYAWIPLTYLPQEVAFGVWRTILMAATVLAVWPLVRRPSPAAVVLTLLVGGLLLSNTASGNVTVLMIGALAVLLPTTAGPFALGVAGSLKVFPLVLVAGYAAERRWRPAAVALLVAALLWAPALLFEPARYPAYFSREDVSVYRLIPGMWPFGLATLLGLMTWLAIRRSRWTWLAAAAAMVILVPKTWLPDIGYLVVAAVMILQMRPDTPSGRGLASRSGTARTSPPPLPGRG